VEINKKGSVLVVFGNDLPAKKGQWWKQFDIVIAPKKLEAKILQCGLSYIDLNSLVDPGNVQEASELARTLSRLKLSDGRRVSKFVNYHGYELWWMHYDDICYKFCFPFTQYRTLLTYLKNCELIYLYKPPFASLFRYFLEAHKSKYEIVEEFSQTIPSVGTFVQLLLSLISFPWLVVRRARLMVWTSDQFDLPRTHDFRMAYIYDELYKKKLAFVEFIRSMESTRTVIHHAILRRRPAIYSYAIVTVTHFLAVVLKGRGSDKKTLNLRLGAHDNPEDDFWFSVATCYLLNVTGDIWSIQAIRFILRCIGIRAAIISAAVNRNFHEVLACKLLGINIVGIQHGLSPRYYFVSDYMFDFDGEKMMSVDRYGLCSAWWKEYYIKNSKAYKSDQLFVSGPMRPLQQKSLSYLPSNATAVIKVLFVSEQLCVPSESLPFLLTLMETANISLYIKFRTYHDGFEEWLKENRPEILEKIGKGKILRGAMHEAISQCDAVVGSHSTGVMEALLQLKPPIFFLTKKWGDYFDLSDCDLEYKFFARNPRELVDCVRKSEEIPRDTLKKLQERFFGDPYQNGSKWVVEQVEDILRNTRQ